MTFEKLLQEKNVVITAGSGGVGKTSSAAAMALATAQNTNRRVLVLTIDPARRLATALGLSSVGNEATEVMFDADAGARAAHVTMQGAQRPGTSSQSGEEARAAHVTMQGAQRPGTSSQSGKTGHLFAAMLDAKQSWADLVNRYAPDEATKKRIFENPLYQGITERFVQSHDYIAMERLWDLHNSGDYDLIIIDTPPSSHASDFLDAPDRMADFFDSRLLKFLVAPTRSSLLSITTRPFLQLADRLLGKRFLSDISEFFSALETMRPGFIERAEKVRGLLRSRETAFVVVTTLEPAPRKEALRFIDQLHERDLALGGVVFNRALPDYLLDPAVKATATSLQGNSQVAQNLAKTAKADQGIAGQVLNELSANFERLHDLAKHEQFQREALASVAEVAVTVPWFEDDLHSLVGLSRLGAAIWR